MVDSSLTQEILHAEIEMVQLYQKTNNLSQLTRPDLGVLLEQLSLARERCDHLLERSMGADRQRVAALKNRIDGAYQTVTEPLLKGVEPVEPAEHTDDVVTEPTQSLSSSQSLSSLVREANPELAEKKLSDTTETAHTNAPTEFQASLHSARIEDLVTSAPDLDSEPPHKHKKATYLFLHALKDFFLSQILVAGIFWVAVFLFISAVSPETIHAIVKWISS